MARSRQLDALLENTRVNAALGWVLVLIVAGATVESLRRGDLVWVVLSAFAVGLAALPAIVYRNVRVMVPWEVLLLVALPTIARSLATQGVLSQLATYVAVAAVALIIAVQLDVFTPVRMTTGFAVVFVVIATMATAGVWAVVQWLSDVYLGTTLIYPTPPPVSEAVEAAALETLMWDFVSATAAGLLGGIVFALYFRERADTRVPLPADEQGRESR
ncbi:MAG: hypothetical protein ABEJ77_03935 [Halanaeroarchaeum sp.]